MCWIDSSAWVRIIKLSWCTHRTSDKLTCERNWTKTLDVSTKSIRSTSFNLGAKKCQVLICSSLTLLLIGRSERPLWWTRPSILRMSNRSSVYSFASTFGLLVRAWCICSVVKALELEMNLPVTSFKIFNPHKVSLKFVPNMIQQTLPAEMLCKVRSISAWVSTKIVHRHRLSCLSYQTCTATLLSTTACLETFQHTTLILTSLHRMQSNKKFWVNRRTLLLVGSYSKESPNMASCTPLPSSPQP